MPMCTKVLVVLGGDLDEELVPRYRRAEQEGTLSIVGYARCTEQGLSVEGVMREVEIHRVLLSCSKLFPMIAYLRRCAPEIPRAALLDGRIFRMPGLDVPRLFAENVGYAPLQAELTDQEEAFLDVTRAEIPRVWSYGSRTVSVGVKSYFGGRIEWGYRGGVQEVRIGNYTSFGQHVVLEVGLNNQHDYRRITTYDPGCMDFDAEDWCSSLGYKSYAGGVHVGSDVWIGRGSFLKAAGDSGILTIGDGAVIAADSVVVKDVPPYAIVGGNPAQIIKYRFPPEMIESLLHLRWWDWPLEKIHEHLDVMNDPAAFLQRHGLWR